MIITFCGHSKKYYNEYTTEVLKLIEKISNNQSVDFFLGGYGNFDEFARKCARIYQSVHPDSRLIYITPYDVDKILHKKRRLLCCYDDIIYPPIQNISSRLAIPYRNRWMIDNADFTIAGVENTYGGAFLTYKYAIQKNVKIYNILKLKSDNGFDNKTL